MANDTYGQLLRQVYLQLARSTSIEEVYQMT